MKKFLLILLCSILILPISGCKKKDNLEEISTNLSLYEISINLDVNSKIAQINQKINFINNMENILKHVKLHLYPQFFKKGATEKIVPSTKMNNTYPNGLSFADFNIDRVRVDGVEKSIIYENEFDSILNIELNSSLIPMESSLIEISYNLTLPNCNHRFGYGNTTINLCNFYPILCVFENEQFNTNGYNANGDPFYSDIANYYVEISIDKQYVVASSGQKIKETNNGDTKSICFKAQAMRDFALVASKDFKVASEKLNNTIIEYFYTDDNNFPSSLKAGVNAIKTFSKLFGNYPYNNFSIVQADFVYGGMEYPSLVIISNDIENLDDYLNVIIHETAHQWWYAVVGNDEYTHPWLDEALTEFSTILFYDHSEGYSLNHKDMIDCSKENYSLFISVYEDVLGTIDTSMRAVDQYNTEPEYTYCIYVKGVLMYESLYQLIGEKTFIKSLQNYFQANKFKNATPKDLINAFENTTKQNLTNFFNSWTNGKVVIR